MHELTWLSPYHGYDLSCKLIIGKIAYIPIIQTVYEPPEAVSEDVIIGGGGGGGGGHAPRPPGLGVLVHTI